MSPALLLGSSPAVALWSLNQKNDITHTTMDTTLKKKVAKLVRLLGTTEHGERANAWRMLMYKMQDVGVNWSDVGNWIEEGDAHNALN